MKRNRRNHYDITDRIRVSHPRDVCNATLDILRERYPDLDSRALRKAFDTFTRLYAGTLPSYLGCDTWYHDTQHSLDCALAMARLLDGHARAAPPGERLGHHRAVLGVIIALFHDAGYIRQHGDGARNGAEYTLNHVGRSGEFLATFLPRIGFGEDVALTRQIVHFTGYEVALDKIKVRNAKDRMLGFLLGTADVLAQTSDRCYLEKCRDYLFREFEICGLAGAGKAYPDVEALLVRTPAFNKRMWEERLDGYFKGAYHYMEAHFGGRDPYVEQIDEHMAHVARLSSSHQLHRLTKRPRSVGADELRDMLGLGPARVRAAGSRAAAEAGAAIA